MHVLNVQPPILSGQVRRFVTQEMIDTYYDEESKSALRSAKELLDNAGIPYTATMEVGHIAETITDYTKQKRCDNVLMGTRGMSAVANLVMGSVATRVLHLVDVPVTFVK